MDVITGDQIQNCSYKECISKQLEEVDMLSSIYCNPGEMFIYDPGVICDFNEYLKDTSSPGRLRAHLDFAITITSSSHEKIEVRVELPHLYPAIENAIVTIRSALLSKPQESFVKTEVENYIASMEKSDTYIFQVISWIQDQIDNFLTKDSTDLELEKQDNRVDIIDFERLWIYSHHIKSKTKRQEIVKQARELNLSGYMRPGKPGIICVEGLKENTQEFWKNIKSMNWHKITLRKNEVKQKFCDKIDTLRRFNGFRELLFAETGDEEGTKISMGQFMTYLEEHKSGYIKKDLFGFD